MAEDTELRWRNSALKYLLVGPGETKVLDAIGTILARSSVISDGLLLCDFWIKGTKKRGRAGEVDPDVARYVVTWGDTTVMVIDPGGNPGKVEDELLVRGNIKSNVSPVDLIDEATFTIETLEVAMERTGAAGAFDEKSDLKRIFDNAVSSSAKLNRL